jgi:hypothetical protein
LSPTILLPGGRNLNHEPIRAGLAWWFRRYAPVTGNSKGLRERPTGKARIAEGCRPRAHGCGRAAARASPRSRQPKNKRLWPRGGRSNSASCGKPENICPHGLFPGPQRPQVGLSVLRRPAWPKQGHEFRASGGRSSQPRRNRLGGNHGESGSGATALTIEVRRGRHFGGSGTIGVLARRLRRNPRIRPLPEGASATALA